MPHSTNKELILGIMVGTAGISLLALWYHKARKPRTAVSLPKFLSLHKTFDSITLQNEMQNDEETGMIFQKRQLQILEKLNELLTNMEELKEEIRFLKETIPKLEECIQGELGGKVTVHKISPQHRARKRKLTTVQSSARSNSSEEAESEGGCYKKDQSCPSTHTAEKATAQHKHHEASSASHPKLALGLITSRPSSSHKGIRKRSSPSNASIHSFLSRRRHSLLLSLQKSNNFPWRQQSRANFDSQEDLTANDLKDLPGTIRLRRSYSSHRLSIVSCYRSTTFFDSPEGTNRIETFPKTSNVSLSDLENVKKQLEKFDATAISPGRWSTVDRPSYQQSIPPFCSQNIASSMNQENQFASVLQQSQQLSRDSKEALCRGSLSHSTRHSPAMTLQLSPNVTSPGELSSSYKKARNLTAAHPKGSFKGERFAASPEDEDDESSAIEKRYITANTDTEEQSFPVPKAFNTHIEELQLDALLQKVDHLRINQSGKTESFELLCDHKEKFKDEVEFMWRLVRAYGDMYEVSTNTQEKKHYANLGKTLGERAVTRAPQNGHCHLWYAVLCGCVSEFEGLQNKINCGHYFKDHLDIAIQLLPEEPFIYYLKGRYCYTVSKLSWIEKKMAATLFGKIPSGTVREALYNFLKAEELQTGYSVSNYMYLAKCYVDLEETQDAWKFCNRALLLPVVTKEDKDAHKEVKTIIASLKR